MWVCGKENSSWCKICCYYNFKVGCTYISFNDMKAGDNNEVKKEEHSVEKHGREKAFEKG